MNPISGRILIVDDEAPIRRGLRTALSGLGFEIVEGARGEEAVSLVRTAQFDVVLLDINMPGMGGMEACRQIRHIAPRLSILILTVLDHEEDKIKALDLGADDYITKPFHVGELTARIRAAIRRTHNPEPESDLPIRVGEIELDPVRRVALKSDRVVRLTPKEFELLRYLMTHAGLPIPHARLLRSVWGPEHGEELEYLRTFICQLRRKLEEYPARPKYLLTDASIGYRFVEAAKVEPAAHAGPGI